MSKRHHCRRALTFDAVVHWFAHWLNDSMTHRRFNFKLISALCCVWHFVWVCYTMPRNCCCDATCCGGYAGSAYHSAVLLISCGLWWSALSLCSCRCYCCVVASALIVGVCCCMQLRLCSQCSSQLLLQLLIRWLLLHVRGWCGVCHCRCRSGVVMLYLRYDLSFHVVLLFTSTSADDYIIVVTWCSIAGVMLSVPYIICTWMCDCTVLQFDI